MSEEQVEVTRWYTSALKIPRLIGKLPSGERIWGGPYTLVQVMVGVGVFIVGIKTMGWWGYSNLLINGITLVGVSATALFLAGQIPSGGTNPAVLIQGTLSQLSRRPVGTWRGAALVAPARATALGGRVSLAAMPEIAPAQHSKRPAQATVATTSRTEATDKSAPQARLTALLKQGGKR